MTQCQAIQPPFYTRIIIYFVKTNYIQMSIKLKKSLLSHKNANEKKSLNEVGRPCHFVERAVREWWTRLDR